MTKPSNDLTINRFVFLLVVMSMLAFGIIAVIQRLHMSILQRTMLRVTQRMNQAEIDAQFCRMPIANIMEKYATTSTPPTNEGLIIESGTTTQTGTTY